MWEMGAKRIEFLGIQDLKKFVSRLAKILRKTAIMDKLFSSEQQS